MEYNCVMITHVIFTKRAFNAIITETIDKNPVETGGIFIGYLLDNGVCIVVETIPPGIKTVNQRAYFEYDADFINYLSNVIAKQYVGNLHVLGLWHRHPGSMDSFSTTDDGTNILFARNNGKYGAISALVNCDPKLRLTMYHVDSNCRYTPIDWSVDGGIIPADFLKLHYEDASNLPILGEQLHNLNTAIPTSSNDNKSNDLVEDSMCQSPETETPNYTIADAIDDFCIIIKKLIYKA